MACLNECLADNENLLFNLYTKELGKSYKEKAIASHSPDRKTSDQISELGDS